MNNSTEHQPGATGATRELSLLHFRLDLIAAEGFVRLARQAAEEGNESSARYCRERADRAYQRAEDIYRQAKELEDG